MANTAQKTFSETFATVVFLFITEQNGKQDLSVRKIEMSKEMQLLQASLAGDRNAFEKIVAKYQSTICAITLSGTGRLDASEELAQETFVNAWEHLDQLRDLRGFRSWLYSIARNAIHNYRRRKKLASIEPNLTEAVAKDTHNPPEILIRKEERAMLEQAIMRLPDKYREPLVMFCREQRSIRESAEALGLTEGTFRTRLHRARQLLREEVAEKLEQALKETGPGKDFTKAVMVTVGAVPIGLSATADAALAGASAAEQRGQAFYFVVFGLMQFALLGLSCLGSSVRAG
ncbi:MAG: sigma-70 family RNA polymerase sigma factor [Sedimentisphaerales bacterium]|nr:sigma-70 family RNA polymerase sigma factor [Sedimentisphaerales bacterium]